MCTQGASRGCRRGAAHLSLRASPRGLTPHGAPPRPYASAGAMPASQASRKAAAAGVRR